MRQTARACFCRENRKVKLLGNLQLHWGREKTDLDVISAQILAQFCLFDFSMCCYYSMRSSYHMSHQYRHFELQHPFLGIKMELDAWQSQPTQLHIDSIVMRALRRDLWCFCYHPFAFFHLAAGFTVDGWAFKVFLRTTWCQNEKLQTDLKSQGTLKKKNPQELKISF